MLRRAIYIVSATVVLLLVVSCVGVLDDVDSCANTSRVRVRRRILGIAVSERVEHTPESQWLLDEMGIDGPVHYEDYLVVPPYLPLASTPGGNWLSLRAIRVVYERNPEARPAIKEYLQRLFASSDPHIDGKFLAELGERYP